MLQLTFINQNSHQVFGYRYRGCVWYAQKGDTRHENHSLPTEIGNAPTHTHPWWNFYVVSHGGLDSLSWKLAHCRSLAKRCVWNKVMDSIIDSVAELALKLNQKATTWSNNVAKTGRHWFYCFERKFKKLFDLWFFFFLTVLKCNSLLIICFKAFGKLLP